MFLTFSLFNFSFCSCLWRRGDIIIMQFFVGKSTRVKKNITCQCTVATAAFHDLRNMFYYSSSAHMYALSLFLHELSLLILWGFTERAHILFKTWMHIVFSFFGEKETDKCFRVLSVFGIPVKVFGESPHSTKNPTPQLIC